MGLAADLRRASDWTVVPTFNFPFRFLLFPAGNICSQISRRVPQINPFLFREIYVPFLAISLLPSNYSFHRNGPKVTRGRVLASGQGWLVG